MNRAREGWRESESVGEVQGVLERARASEGCGGTGSVTEGLGELERAREGYRRPGRVEEVRGVRKLCQGVLERTREGWRGPGHILYSLCYKILINTPKYLPMLIISEGNQFCIIWVI